jgi:DNA/RNA endonuclease G (NUC1)
MSLRQSRAAALDTESGEATVAGLESYILNSAHARIQSLRRHCSAYTDEDPVLEGDSVRVPQELWKMVGMEDSEHNKLRAAAYWLGSRAADPSIAGISQAS